MATPKMRPNDSHYAHTVKAKLADLSISILYASMLKRSLTKIYVTSPIHFKPVLNISDPSLSPFTPLKHPITFGHPEVT